MKAQLRSIASRYVFVVTEMLLLRAFVRAGSIGRKENCSANTVVLNPPGAGNIGDQAMFESFVQNTSVPVTAVVRSETAYAYDNLGAAQGFETCCLRDLVYGRGVRQWRDGFRLGRVLRKSSAFAILGADLMDGCYGLRPSAMQWALCAAALDSGTNVRIVGFSWNSDANRHIVRLARLANARGAELMVRDPDSYQRILDHGVERPTQVADVVFLLDSDQGETELYAALSALKHRGRRIAVVNISGLIGSRYDQIPEYVAILEHLLAEQYAVAVVPHVSHASSDDVAAQSPVLEKVKSENLFSVDHLLRPAEVRRLASVADLVVTGRMHLSILAFCVGVPSIVFSTSGKVSGLMSYMQLPDFAVEPRIGCSRNVIDCIEHIHANRSAVVEGIASGVRTGRMLAAVNFARTTSLS